MVALGTYRRDLHPRVAVLIDGLLANGAAVTEVNEPLPLDTAARVGMLHRPWLVPRLALTLALCWVRLWRRARKLDVRPDMVLVGYMGHFDVHLARLCFPGVPVLLDHLLSAADTARDRRSAGAAVQAALRVLDGAAVRSATTVLVDTPEHAAMVPPDAGPDVVVVPVGAELDWFDVPARSEEEGPLRVLFFGLFTPLQGTPVIAEAVRRLPPGLEVSVVLVGTGQDHHQVRAALQGDDRVRMVDWADRATLLGLTADSDVVLGIFGTSAKALRVVPTKVYQGLAAGRAVITSDTPAQRAAVGDGAVLVPPGDAAALADAITSLARDRDRLRATSAAARRRAEADFTPAAVTRGLLVPPRVRTRRPPMSPMGILRWRAVEPQLARLAPRTVLEIGCGQGAAGTRIAAMPSVDYTGVEPDSSSYEVAARRLQGLGTVVNGEDVAVLELQRRWDLVCAFEVLEHIEDDEAALHRWHGLCAEGGHVVLSVPAWQARFGASDTLVGHYRRYSPQSVAELLRRTGWEPVLVQLYAPFIGRLMERIRNVIAARRLESLSEEDTMARRSGTSGRFLQPGVLLYRLASTALVPFDLWRRLDRGRHGNGIVVVARRVDRPAQPGADVTPGR